MWSTGVTYMLSEFHVIDGINLEFIYLFLFGVVKVILERMKA